MGLLGTGSRREQTRARPRSRRSAAKTQTLLSSLTSSSTSAAAATASSTMQSPVINFTLTTTRTAAGASAILRTKAELPAFTGPNESQIQAPAPPPPSSKSFNNNNNNSSKNETRRIFKTRNGAPCSHHSNNLAFLALVGTIFIMTFLLFICIGNVTSLNCYTCSSYDNPACDESFSIAGNLTGTDCNSDGRQGKVCRKLVQYIEKKKVVIRECGYLNEHEDKERKPMCYKRSGTFALLMESCICYDDLCNHSASLVPNQSVLLVLILATSGLVMMANHRGGFLAKNIWL